MPTTRFPTARPADLSADAQQVHRALRDHQNKITRPVPASHAAAGAAVR